MSKVSQIITIAVGTMTYVKTRRQINIKVTDHAKKVIEGYAERNEAKELGIASRIYEWFGQQTETVQFVVLGWAKSDEAISKARREMKPLDNPVDIEIVAVDVEVDTKKKGAARIRDDLANPPTRQSR